MVYAGRGKTPCPLQFLDCVLYTDKRIHLVMSHQQIAAGAGPAGHVPLPCPHQRHYRLTLSETKTSLLALHKGSMQQYKRGSWLDTTAPSDGRPGIIIYLHAHTGEILEARRFRALPRPQRGAPPAGLLQKMVSPRSHDTGSSGVVPGPCRHRQTFVARVLG